MKNLEPEIKKLERIKSGLEHHLNKAQTRLNECQQEAINHVITTARKEDLNLDSTELDYWVRLLLKEWEESRDLRDLIPTLEDSIGKIEKEITALKQEAEVAKIQRERNKQIVEKLKERIEKYKGVLAEYDALLKERGKRVSNTWWIQHGIPDISPKQTRNILEEEEKKIRLFNK